MVMRPVILLLIYGIYIGNGSDTDDWKPSNRHLSRKEFLRVKGMTRTDYEYVRRMMPKLNALAARTLGIKYILNNDSKDILMDGVALTPLQIKFLYKMYLREITENQKRQKRKISEYSIEDNVAFPTMKWQLPILYKLDNNYSRIEKDYIKQAISHWQDNTCIKFRRLKLNANVTRPHLLFVNNNNNRCYSFIGQHPPRTDCDLCSDCVCPQILALTSQCARSLGATIHEIGHAIGFTHEHERTDRDEFITVHEDNILDGQYGEFSRKKTEAYNVPYDYSSLMHYGPTIAVNKRDNVTMTATDPRFKSTFGQVTLLSFLDKKLANLHYCNDTCKTELPCQRGGFTNPSGCNKCLCPDGFGGTLCEEVAPSSKACDVMSKGQYDIKVKSLKEKCIIANGYNHSTHCNWYLHSSKGTKIQLRFRERKKFGLVFCQPYTCCYDWLEIRYDNNLRPPGPRFCAAGTLDKKRIISEGNEVMVNFRSFRKLKSKNRIGFILCYKVIRPRKRPRTFINIVTDEDHEEHNVTVVFPN